MLLAVFSTTLMAADKLYNAYYKELESASKEQKACLIRAYKFGIGKDLSETLAVIVWKESDMGRITINKTDGKYGSYGAFQCLVGTVKDRHHIKGQKQIKQLAYKLNHDFDFSANEAVTELDTWKRYWSSKKSKDNISVYRKMIASYNAGGRGYYSPKGKKYADNFAVRLRVLHDYVAANKELFDNGSSHIQTASEHSMSLFTCVKSNVIIYSMCDSEKICMTVDKAHNLYITEQSNDTTANLVKYIVTRREDISQCKLYNSHPVSKNAYTLAANTKLSMAYIRLLNDSKQLELNIEQIK